MNTCFFKPIIGLLLGVALLSCKKQVVNEYEVNELYVSSQTGNKANLKSDLQLITIMYADVFGKSIESNELKSLNQTYLSFGDKNVVIDRITQHFLVDPNADIPTDVYMRTNLDQFIAEAYARFFVRKPTEAEVYYLKKAIQGNGQLTAKDVFYALLTSEEYKYY